VKRGQAEARGGIGTRGMGGENVAGGDLLRRGIAVAGDALAH
jgi:hypothetical protein